MSSLFRLKFKIDLLEKLCSLGAPKHRSNFEEYQMINKGNENLALSKFSGFSLSLSKLERNKINQGFSYKNKYSKYSVRSSKVFPYGDVEGLLGNESLSENLNGREREELINYMKNLDNLSSLSNTINIINNKKYYEKISSGYGIETIRATFQNLVLKIKKNFYPILNNYGKEAKLPSYLFDIENEIEFFLIFNEVMNINDIKASNIFDLFKNNFFDVFNDKHFVLLFLFCAAFECGNLREFLKQFGDDFYSEISDGQNVITVSRLKNCGEILGVDNRIMEETLEKLNIVFMTYVNVEKFKVFFNSLSAPQTQSNISSNSNKKNSSQNCTQLIIDNNDNSTTPFHGNTNKKKILPSQYNILKAKQKINQITKKLFVNKKK